MEQPLPIVDASTENRQTPELSPLTVNGKNTNILNIVSLRVDGYLNVRNVITFYCRYPA